MYYYGEFSHSLDARNRVTVPSIWRVKGDDENFYMAWPHPSGYLAVFPPEKQAELLQRARSIAQSDTRGRQLLRNVFGRAAKFGCDKQGRILIPEHLLQHAAIDKKVVLVGTGDQFEIWGAERYQPAEVSGMEALEAMKELGL